MRRDKRERAKETTLRVESKEKKAFDNMKKNLGTKRKEVREKSAADKLLEQTSSCITFALKRKSFEELQVAHGRLEGYKVLKLEENKANKETYIQAKTLRGKHLL